MASRNILQVNDLVYVCINASSSIPQFLTFDVQAAANGQTVWAMAGDASKAAIFTLGGSPGSSGQITLQGSYVDNTGKSISVGYFGGDESTHDLYFETMSTVTPGFTWFLTTFGSSGMAGPYLYGTAYILSNPSFTGQEDLQIDPEYPPYLTTAANIVEPITLLPATTTPYYYCDGTTCRPIVPQSSFNTTQMAATFTVNPHSLIASGVLSGSNVQSIFHDNAQQCQTQSSCTQTQQPPPNGGGKSNNKDKDKQQGQRRFALIAGGILIGGALILYLSQRYRQRQTQTTALVAKRF